MSTSLEKARQELEKEFAQFRDGGLGRIHEIFDKVIAAGPTDDVHGLLKQLQDVVSDVRTGGLLGSGAQGHREAREEWLKASGR